MHLVPDSYLPRAIRPFQSKLEPLRVHPRDAAPSGGATDASRRLSPGRRALRSAPSAIFSFVKVRAKRRSLYALPPSENRRSLSNQPANTKAREFFTSAINQRTP